MARFKDELARRGFGHEVVLLDRSARTAAEAADALGCEVGQIAKSLVFRGEHSGRPVLVVAEGTNRVDEEKVAALIGEPIGRADAAFVREKTGYAIGGVPPLGHTEPPVALVEEDLLRHPRVWAAAGHPNAVFGLDPQELPAMTGGRVADVKR
jgi:prolyl-tRNA editing enzyme YbaK/EbsC (Cys-tRNA(Pro) deacylase)